MAHQGLSGDGDGPKITAEDKFEAMRRMPCYYMPRAETQRATGMFPFKFLLAYNFSSSNWSAHDATFAASHSSDLCRDNVSLFLKMMHWAFQVMRLVHEHVCVSARMCVCVCVCVPTDYSTS